jgi:hypothetical protein
MRSALLKWYWTCGFALVLTAVTIPVGAQAPTRVSVETQLAAQRFRITFRDRAAAIQDSVSARLIALLGDDARFLRFTKRDPAARYRLIFTLDRRERNSTAPFPEYGFWARLERADGTPIELYWKALRPAGVTAQAIGSERDFLDDVDAMLVEPGLAPIRTQLLSRVPIATSTLASRTPLGWALPIANDSLCMQRFTILEVFAVFREGGGQGVDRPDTARVVSQPFAPASPRPGDRPFLRKLFSEPVSRQKRDELGAALANGSVEGREVFVLDYRRDPNVCRPPVAPGRANAGGRS